MDWKYLPKVQNTNNLYQIVLPGCICSTNSVQPGHPRSGTTLLEQVLAAHPSLAAIDESEAFPTEIWDQLAPMHAAQPLTVASLNALPAERRAGLGRNYFKSLLRELPADL